MNFTVLSAVAPMRRSHARPTPRFTACSHVSDDRLARSPLMMDDFPSNGAAAFTTMSDTFVTAITVCSGGLPMRATGAGPAWIFCTESRAGAAIPPPRRLLWIARQGSASRSKKSVLATGPVNFAKICGAGRSSAPGAMRHPCRAGARIRPEHARNDVLHAEVTVSPSPRNGLRRLPVRV